MNKSKLTLHIKYKIQESIRNKTIESGDDALVDIDRLESSPIINGERESP